MEAKYSFYSTKICFEMESYIKRINLFSRCPKVSPQTKHKIKKATLL